MFSFLVVNWVRYYIGSSALDIFHSLGSFQNLGQVICKKAVPRSFGVTLCCHHSLPQYPLLSGDGGEQYREGEKRKEETG